MHKSPEQYRKLDRPNMKGGCGDAHFQYIWEKNSEMKSTCRMFAKITLDPGCSIGKHDHQGEEEIFYILSGEALAYDNGETVILKPGDSIICRSGEEHAMSCYGDVPVEYLAVIPVYPENKSE